MVKMFTYLKFGKYKVYFYYSCVSEKNKSLYMHVCYKKLALNNAVLMTNVIDTVVVQTLLVLYR